MKILLLLTSLSFIFFGNSTNKVNDKRLDNQSINVRNDREKTKEIALDNADYTSKNAALKTGQPNINQVLWLRKKYNIELIHSHCLMTSNDMAMIDAQNKAILLKYGNDFWVRLANELDSIEKNNLGYKKTALLDLKKYLNRHDFTIDTSAFPNEKAMFAFTDMKIDSNGKLLNIEMNVSSSERGKSKEFENKLTQLLGKAPFTQPSTFLNEGIDDRVQIFITALK